MVKIPPIKCGLFYFNITDYHAILGVPIGSSPNEVRKRYMKNTRILFPDVRKLESQEEEELADKILSNFVNPAYEQLFKNESARKDHLLILDNLGNQLAQKSELPLKSKTAKELAQAGNDLDRLYRQYLHELAKEEYKVISKSLERIALISELNLVYLSQKSGKLQGQKVASAQGKQSHPPADSSGEAAKQTQPQQSSQQQPTPSPSDAYIRRGKQFLDKKDYSHAIMELREALKMNAKNSQAHGLLGWTYIQQGQLTMAKPHINKALEFDPDNETAQKAKQFIDRQTSAKSDNNGKASATKKSKSKKQSGLLGGVFGKKKK